MKEVDNWQQEAAKVEILEFDRLARPWPECVDLGVGDLFLAVVWEIPEPYDVEGVSAFDTL